MLAFIISPIIAIATQGRYHLAREPADDSAGPLTLTCITCGYDYERRDMTTCPFHHGTICSLCCSLESACEDVCKPAHGTIPATAPGLAAE